MSGLGIFAWVVLGGVAGWLAGRIAGTGYRQGYLLDVVTGIVGALIGGFAFTFLGGGGANVNEFSPYSLPVAVLGAAALLAIEKSIRGRD